MIIPMLALQAAITATVVPRTLESETLDGYDLRCTVADDTWKTYDVELAQRGGRAFDSEGDEGREQIFRTPIYSRVIADQTGELKGLGGFEKLIEKPGYGYSSGPVEFAGDNNRASIRLAEVSAHRFAITIVQVGGSSSKPYAGFCSVKIIPQKPLTKAEAGAHLRDPWRIP
jgi:hypothetical protein